MAGQMLYRLKYKSEKFDATADWSDYLKYFEKVSEWNGWPDYEKAAQLLSLTGVACQVWSDRIESIKTTSMKMLVQEYSKK